MTRLVVCMVLIAMLVTAATAVAQEGVEEESWYDRVSMSGYFHARYIDTDQEGEYDTFDFRRMYVTIRGEMDRTTGIITFSRVGPNDPNIDLYNAFVDYKIGDRYAIQFGQVPTWFGLEAWEGSSVRDTLERAKILEGGPGFYFAGAPDRGIWLRRAPTPETWEPLIIFGVWNGQFRSDDANDDKNVSLDLKWNAPWGQFGASWFDGTYVDGTGNEADRGAVDLYVRLFPAPWGVQAEWADGELLGADRDGYYLHGSYLMPNGTDKVYGRYQEFNADTAMTSTNYEAWTLGWARELDENNEITVEYTDGDWTSSGGEDQSSGGSDDMFGVQWQYAFR
ncbi:MAG: porin [Armatimonadota bacterium]|nr:porin [Armatimonadota bacterium]